VSLQGRSGVIPFYPQVWLFQVHPAAPVAGTATVAGAGSVTAVATVVPAAAALTGAGAAAAKVTQAAGAAAAGVGSVTAAATLVSVNPVLPVLQADDIPVMITGLLQPRVITVPVTVTAQGTATSAGAGLVTATVTELAAVTVTGAGIVTATAAVIPAQVTIAGAGTATGKPVQVVTGTGAGAGTSTTIITQAATASAAVTGSVTAVTTQTVTAALAGAGSVTAVTTQTATATIAGAGTSAAKTTQLATTTAAGAGAAGPVPVTQTATSAAAGAATITAVGISTGAATAAAAGAGSTTATTVQAAKATSAGAGSVTATGAASTGITLVHQGTITSNGSPAFGQATGTGHLLVAFTASNGSTGSCTITTAASGWVLAAAGGTAYIWSALWYKPNCGASETAPVFTDPNGAVQFAQLAEYAAVATSSPVDHAAGVYGGASVPTFSATLAPDTQAGDLVAVCGFWNGANSGGTVSVTQFTDSTGTPITPHLQQATGGSLYLASLWGITGNTGGSGDTAYLGLSVFDQCGGAVASFKAASPVAEPLTVTPQTLPGTWLDFPYSPQKLAGTGGTPPYTWSSTGSLPPGVSLSAAGILSGSSATSAGTFNFTAIVTDSVSGTATLAQSITISPPRSPFTTLTTTTSLTGNLGAYNDPAEMTPASNGYSTYVSANQVGPISYSELLGAYSPSMWFVTATAGPPGNGSVQMGPCSSQSFANWGATGWASGTGNTPLSALSALTSTYDVTDPPTGSYELEFDVWTGYTGASGTADTTVASGSNGGTISGIASWAYPSAGVLAVASTAAFTAAGLTTGTLLVATSGSGPALVTYTGISGNTFTGCAYVSGSAVTPGTVATGGYAYSAVTRDIMIWLDTSTERGAGGAILYTPNLNFGGLMFDLYYYPYPYPSGPVQGAELMFILQGAGGAGTFGNLTSGTVDLLGPMNYLISQGFFLGNPAYLYLSLFGWEICNTDTAPGSGVTGTDTYIVNSFTYNYTLSGTGTGTAAVAGAASAAAKATQVATAAVAGAGSVTAVGTSSGTATAASAGAGSVTAVTTQIVAAAGAGASTATAKPVQVAGSAATSGGSVTTSTVQVTAATATGAGTITAVAAQGTGSTVAGAGSVTSTVTQATAATVTGAGAVTAVGSILGQSTAIAAGAGSATAAATQVATATVAGAGSVTAAPTQTATATVAGAGAVTAAGISSGTATATVTGAGNTTAVITQVVTGIAAGAGATTTTTTQITKATTAGAGTVTANGQITGTGAAAGTGAVTAKPIQASKSAAAGAGLVTALILEAITGTAIGAGNVTAGSHIQLAIVFGRITPGTGPTPRTLTGTGAVASSSAGGQP
jgi:large repetitive protein